MRYDRLMALGWKYLIEIAILWVIVLAAIEVADQEDWNPLVTTLTAGGIAVFAYTILWLAIPKPGERVEDFR